MRRTINNAIDPDTVRIAKSLNIETQGKTKEQIINEILRKLSNEGNKN
ncbi:hypothetical protein JCM14467A_24920 [Vulcanisaeta sp. JCM 14467]